jgi:hypothetical protein
MQAVMALRFDDTALARLDACRACFHDPWGGRNVYTLILSLLPKRFCLWLDASLRRFI